MNTSSHSLGGGLEAGHGQALLEALAVGEHDGVAADRHRHFGLSAAEIDADRGSRRIRIGGGAVRLLDLKQLHADWPIVPAQTLTHPARAGWVLPVPQCGRGDRTQ